MTLAATSMLTSCERPNTSTSQVLHRGNGGEPGTLDPLLADDVHAFRVLTDIYEGLVAVDAEGQVTPGAAQTWTVSDDGLVWRFELRDSARWSDGSRVVAGDFVRSIQQLATDEYDSTYESLLSPIANFNDVNLGDAAPDSLGVRALADNVVEFRLTEPTPYWLSILTLAVALPTPPVENLYNGAYRLVDRRVNSTIRLRRNPAYWDAKNVAIDEVVYHSIDDPLTEFNRYATGEIQITANVPVNSLQSLRKERPEQLQISPSLGLYYLAFDLTEAPMDNHSVRRALNLSIDRERLTEFLGRGEQPAFGIVPAGVPGYSPARYQWQKDPLEQRQQRARDLLEAAGYDSENPVDVTLIYDPGYLHERVALLVKNFWERLGVVSVNIEKRGWQYFLATRYQRQDWDSMRFSWIGDYNDPTTFLDVFRSDSEQNLPGYKSEAFDAILSAATVLSGDERAEKLRQAEFELMDDHAIAPLYFYTSRHLVSPRVAGFKSNLIDRHPSKYLSLNN